MEKGETGMNISGCEVGRNIEDEAAENNGEDHKYGGLPYKGLTFSACFPFEPCGVTVRVIHYLVLICF